VTVFGCLILITVVFSILLLRFLLYFKFRLRRHTKHSRQFFYHIYKHIEVRQSERFSAARPIFNYLPGVWKCGETWSVVFDKLRKGEGGDICSHEQS